MASHDVILRGGRIVDPVSGRDEVADIAFEGETVAAVGDLGGVKAAEEVDVSGLVVMPGIIDAHVHLSPWLGGGLGHRMLAAAGVTCALDMAGPIDGVVDLCVSHGVGLTVACIDYVRPGHTVTSPDPHAAELNDTLARARRAGAIGLKILGGHFPLTAEASGRTIEVCAAEGAHVAFHSGTIGCPQSIAAMRQSCELTNGLPLHLAHINSYARGVDAPGVLEGHEATQILEAHPNVWSESYLAPFNGNSGMCSNGVPESWATQRNLARGGFPETEQGLVDAILAGWCMVHRPTDEGTVLTPGESGLAAWRAAAGGVGISFPANPPEPRMHLVTARRPDGRFAVDALATDGGGIPRNDLCERGLALVHLDGLSMADFVEKTSVAPARVLGLAGRKGSLAPGFDADATIIDLAARRPVHSFAHGRAVLRDSRVVGRGCRMLAPKEARAALESKGLGVIAYEPGALSRAR